MRNIELSISEVLDKAWELTKKHGILLAVIYFVFFIVYELLGVTAYPSGYWSAIFSGDTEAIQAYSDQMGFYAMTPVSWILSIVFSAGFYRMILLIAKEELPSPSFDAFKMEAMTYVKFFCVSLCFGVVVILGFACFILPGIYLCARLGFAELYILENPNASIGEAFSVSWKMTEGNVLVIVGIGIVAGLISMLGLLACCIGVYYTMVIATFCFVVTYLTLRENLLNE